jgi:hypothetical protein
MFSKDDLIKEAAPKTCSVEVPEWKATLTIRELSAEEVFDLGKDEHGKELDQKTSTAKGIVMSVVDPETGLPVFTEADIPAIKKFGASGTMRLQKAINELNGVSTEARKN